MKRFLSSVLAFVFFVSLFTLSLTTNQASAASKITLKLGAWSSSPAEKKIVQNQIADFQKKYPNVQVKLVEIVGDYNQKMQLLMASKTEPDIFYMDSSVAWQYITKNTLEPIDNLMKKYNVKTIGYENSLLVPFTYNGKIYGIPKDYNTLVLFYNKQMFKEAGLTNPPKNWDELRDYAKKLTKGNVVGLTMNLELARIQPFAYQNGGKVFDNGKPVFDDQKAIEGLTFALNLFKDGICKTPKDLGAGWVGDAFADKKAAMTIEGGWMIPFLNDRKISKDSYGIAELPVGPQGKSTMAFTVAYVLSKNSKHKDEAFKLIRFLTGEGGQKYVVEAGLALPSLKSAGNNFAKTYPERKALVDGSKYAYAYFYGVDGSKVLDVFNKSFEDYYYGKKYDLKKNLQDRVKQIFK
ncbi:extracellular solute-binding protein [Caldicellulosiruptoraceae bacterium PP1]